MSPLGVMFRDWQRTARATHSPASAAWEVWFLIATGLALFVATVVLLGVQL